MIQVFEEVGYVVEYKVLNTLDQKRKRIIIGVRKDIREQIGEAFEFPTPYTTRLTLKDILH